MTTVLDRFLNYVSYPTMSDEASGSCPSTEKQRVFAKALVEEMLEMGIGDARMDENGYVYGTVPGDPRLPVIGLIAHMDTSPDAPDAPVRPRVVAYTGGDIVLNQEKNILLRESDYPEIARHKGKHLVVTDGTTLLGADDKAGIAEILTAAQHLMTARIAHSTLKIAFTPDEEIGQGADRFDIPGFGAEYAYTVDGGTVGEIEYENFNAASASVSVFGTSIHPGSAKGKMKNAQKLAMEFASLLPADQTPETTEGYEGFFHLVGMQGSVEQAQLHYIIRDHDMEKFMEKKELFHEIGKKLNEKYGKDTFVTVTTDSYYNMKKCIEPVMYVVQRAKTAMEDAGMRPVEVPIRGGTDGARLSYEGLPCPNLCTGGANYHGRFEYIPVEDMEQCVQMLVNILTGAGIG